MGVPKFFRYISERYPCLSELARERCIPDFDNLYLDMNGIIHNCSHPDDGNIHFSITEEDMFKDIFNYIDKLFFLIKPQKLFFMAVDGVAPRAKMNQQRSRRFRAAKDAELLSLQAKTRGELIENPPFDSNCITPGTEFMERLHNALRTFVKKKICTDPLWQKCRVILSGHDTPGEGEHKIMDYIRYLKSQKDFDQHTRHCLYGLDADLIILGLCTHELHFVVLREEVKFGKKTKRASIEETRFFLLHLGLFREYLEMEFSDLKEYESFSMSKLIDDWVLMGFLVGNDFIPHLPCLHISSNALPLVYQAYIEVYPKLGGNINEYGVLNLGRLEIFLEALSKVEFQIFQENYADLKYFEAKQSKNTNDETFDFEVNDTVEQNHDDDLAQLIENSRLFFEGNDINDITSEDEEQHILDEFKSYKRDYYIKKLNYEEMSSDVLAAQSKIYVTALQWILNYYYLGVPSWSWYYPHHYAPFISDLKNFKDLSIEFDIGKPFLPFEQLLAVLPAASRNLLPVAYQDLFVSPDSEIIHFYPNNFETDLNGKKNEWEAVVLIPFIDENLLLRSMKKCESNLKPDEEKRNSHGPMIQYDFTLESQNEFQSSCTKTVSHIMCSEKPLWRDKLFVFNKKSPLVELEDEHRNVFYPGFPTMKHLKYTFEMRNARVKVFDYPARNESIILLPKPSNNCDDIESVSKRFLNQIVYIGWPHLIKAKVTSVSNEKLCMTTSGAKENNSRIFETQLKSVREHLSSRMGIDIGECKALVHVKILIGSSITYGSQGKVIIQDVWSEGEINYPAQIVVMDISVHNTHDLILKKVENIFPVDSRIFFVGNPYFGSEGLVLNPMLVYECGRLKVSMTVLPEPDLSEPRALQSYLESDYLNTYQAQSVLGISAKCLLRLTAQMLLIMGEKKPVALEGAKKVNIGLHMRFPKQNEELSGYTRKKDNSWFFSQKAITLIEEYFKKFPVVINHLTQSCSSQNYEYCHESDLFPNNVGGNNVDEIVKWLAEQEFSQAERVPCGTKRVEKEAVEKLLESIENLKTLPVKTVKLQVKPHLLMKPDVNLPEQYKPKRPIRLFDRIVVVRNTYLVPVGSKGTVIGILPVLDANPVRLECVRQITYFLDVLFDKTIAFGNSIYEIAGGRVMRVPETAILLIFDNDNNSRNENNESKALSKIQVPNNYSHTTITPNIQSNTKSKTSAIKKNEHNINECLLKTNVSKEDFWMPTPDSKSKHYDINADSAKKASNQKSYHHHVEKNNTSSTLQKKIAPKINSNNDGDEYNSGTEALKNLLGLQKPSASETNTTLPSTPLVNASQFPPPPKWRNNDIFLNNNNEQMLALCPMDEGNKNVPLYYYGKCLPHFAPQQQLPFVNDNFYSPVSLSHKGAFIPLQVMKSCPNNLVQDSIDLGKIENKIKNYAIDTSHKKASSDVEKSLPDISTNHQLGGQEKPVMLSKKTPKAPKIAAKFDNV